MCLIFSNKKTIKCIVRLTDLCTFFSTLHTSIRVFFEIFPPSREAIMEWDSEPRSYLTSSKQIISRGWIWVWPALDSTHNARLLRKKNTGTEFISSLPLPCSFRSNDLNILPPERRSQSAFWQFLLPSLVFFLCIFALLVSQTRKKLTLSFEEVYVNSPKPATRR